MPTAIYYYEHPSLPSTPPNAKGMHAYTSSTHQPHLLLLAKQANRQEKYTTVSVSSRRTYTSTYFTT
jgi:hypothetical protein